MKLETELRLSYYRELEEIAPGHRVKLVRHTETGRLFVLKTLTVYDRSVYRRLKELQLPGLPRIEELIEEDGTLYVVEEYISGESLRSLLNRSGTVDERTAADCICRLCGILSPLHRLEPPIVHRDIKPENILITAGGEPVLVDFNSARVSRENEMRDTVLIGTNGYAAPEQYGFSASGPTADIYALGVLLNELLTGCLPNEKRAGGRLAPILDRCLKMDAADRYQTVTRLREALLPAVRESGKKKKNEAWRSWLLPGFRGKNPAVLALAVFWYALWLYCCLALQINGQSGGAAVWSARLLCLTIFVLGMLWGGNYRGVWKKMPLSNSNKPGQRLLGAVLWEFALICTLFMVGIMVLGVLFPNIG